MRRVLFVHVPRTGGTTIEAVLRDRFPGQVSPVYWDGPLVLADERQLQRHPIVAGHQLAYVRDVVRPDVVVTFLRDPVERARSLYGFMLDTKPDETRERYADFMDCARTDPKMQNHQVRFLSLGCDWRRLRAEVALGRVSEDDALSRLWDMRTQPVDEVHLEIAKRTLDELDFVGSFERFSTDVRRLLRVLGHRDVGPLPRERTTSRSKDEVAAITAQERAELLELNTLDAALLEHQAARTGGRGVARSAA